MHSFPSGVKAATAWPERFVPSASSVVDQPAYQDLHQRASKTTDLTDGEIRCGIIEVAGTSAGAAFVQAVSPQHLSSRRFCARLLEVLDSRSWEFLYAVLTYPKYRTTHSNVHRLTQGS